MPELIESKGTYIHKPTKTSFPEESSSYVRKTIYSFDKQNESIEVTYNNKKPENNLTVKIHLYPAGDGTEGRLRSEYLRSLNSFLVLSKTKSVIRQYPIKSKGEKYICNGFKAEADDKELEEKSSILVYECGCWFLKIEITSNKLDSTEAATAESYFLNKYNPSELTLLHPLNLKSDLLIAPGLKKFGVNVKYVFKSAFKKLKWANENISENERASGFPDLYLGMHIEALKEFIQSDTESIGPINELEKFINGIREVYKAGYLAEFIMKYYKMVMIVPENMRLDYEGFAKWKNENNFSVDFHRGNYMIANTNKFAIDLPGGCYLIVYRQKK